MSIPDGWTYIEGRDGYRARALLMAADDVGLPQESVQAQRGGYLVPDAVAEAYEKGQATPVEDEQSTDEPVKVVPDDSWKNADIEAYAADNGIDLGGATKKADMLAAIAATGEKE